MKHIKTQLKKKKKKKKKGLFMTFYETCNM